MAVRLPDGSIQMSDGRRIYANSVILAADFCELIPLFSPPPAWPFVSGGGGGGPGPQGPAGPAGSGGGGGSGAQGFQGFQGTNPGAQGPQGDLGAQGFQGAAGAGVDIFAATLVVNATGANAHFTTLEAAIAALPAEGGYIYVREGTYIPPAGGYILPNVPVKIYGSGRGNTIFTPASGDRAFSLGSSQYAFGDFSILGDSSVGQTCFFSSIAAGFLTTTIERVSVGTNIFGASPVEIFYDGNGTQRQTNFMDLDVFNGGNATGFFIKNSAAGFRSDFARCKVRGTPSVQFIGFSSVISFVDCLLFPAFPAADAVFITPASSHVNVISSTIVLLNAALTFPIAVGGTCFFEASILQGPISIISESDVVGCAIFGTITISGSRCRIIGNRFTAITGTSITLTSTSDSNTVSGNTFDGATLEIQSDGVLSVVTGNTCRALLSGNLKIAEGITADRNVYEGNIGLTTINPMNAGSMRNNWRTTLVGADTLLTEIHRTVLVDASAAVVVITLPPAATVRHQTYTIKKIDASANTVDVTANGVETIDGLNVQQLAAQWDSIRIVSSGTAWFIEADLP